MQTEISYEPQSSGQCLIRIRQTREPSRIPRKAWRVGLRSALLMAGSQGASVLTGGSSAPKQAADEVVHHTVDVLVLLGSTTGIAGMLIAGAVGSLAYVADAMKGESPPLEPVTAVLMSEQEYLQFKRWLDRNPFAGFDAIVEQAESYARPAVLESWDDRSLPPLDPDAPAFEGDDQISAKLAELLVAPLTADQQVRLDRIRRGRGDLVSALDGAPDHPERARLVAEVIEVWNSDLDEIRDELAEQALDKVKVVHRYVRQSHPALDDLRLTSRPA